MKDAVLTQNFFSRAIVRVLLGKFKGHTGDCEWHPGTQGSSRDRLRRDRERERGRRSNTKRGTSEAQWADWLSGPGVQVINTNLPNATRQPPGQQRPLITHGWPRSRVTGGAY